MSRSKSCEVMRMTEEFMVGIMSRKDIPPGIAIKLATSVLCKAILEVEGKKGLDFVIEAVVSGHELVGDVYMKEKKDSKSTTVIIGRPGEC